MSVSAISGSVQIYPSVQLGSKTTAQPPISVQSQPISEYQLNSDPSAPAVKLQQDNIQQQVTAEAQQTQAQNDNVTSVNLYV